MTAAVAVAVICCALPAALLGALIYFVCQGDR